MKKLKRFLLIPLASLFGLSVMVAGDNGISAHAANYTANWGTHELVQQSDYDLRDGATESQFISYGPSAVGKVWYSRSVANYYDLDKVTVLTSYAQYDNLLKQGTYSASTVKDQIEYVNENYGYDVIGGINGTSFNTANGAPNMGLMINGVEYCPGNYFSHGFFGILKHEETGHQRAVIGRSGEYAGFRDGTTTSRVENGVTVDYTGYKLWQAIGAWYDAILIEDGQICGPETWNEEHPRTAIGITADGDVVTYVVEGRNGNRAGGMSLYNMATVMKELGCVYAVNLDGGGSSTALSKHAGENFYRNGIQGAYGADRSVGDAILFVSTESMTDTGTEEPDTTFNKAHILPNNDLFVVGTTIEFEATGSNAYGDPVALPEGLVWELDETKSTANIGTIDPETGVFTANGTTSGNVYVNLKDGETVVGSTKVDLAWPDWSYSEAFSTKFTMGLGETKELPFTVYPSANDSNKALGISTWRPMIIQENDIEWNVPNGCTMKVNDEGTFYLQAGNNPAIGTVSINKFVATGQTNVMTKVASVEIGKAPTMLYDFEDEDWLNDWAAGGNAQSKTMYKTTDPEEVLFGNGAMAIDYDMSNGNYIGGMDPNKANNRTVLFYNDKQGFTPVVPADAKYVGMWVYFPEGLDGCWFRLTLQGYKTDGSGNLTTAITTMTNFVVMDRNPKVDMGIQGSGEWRFYYTEIGWDTRYGKAWEGIQGPYGFYQCQVMWSAFADTALGYDYNQPAGDTPEEKAFNKEIARATVEANFEKAKIGTIYVDNVMALYGAPTSDMLAPNYSKIETEKVSENNNTFSFNLFEENRYDTEKEVSINNFSTSVPYVGDLTHTSDKLGNLLTQSGLDLATLKVYLNGTELSNTEYTLDEATGLITIPNVAEIKEGTSVRVVCYDLMANLLDRTSTVRSIKYISGDDNTVQSTYLFWDRDGVSGVEAPTPLDKVGHDFVEWKGVVPSVMPNENIEIIAQYTPRLHNVTVVDQNGEEIATYENVPYGSEVTLPVQEGYTIVWKEGTNTVMPDSDVTLEVVKTVNQYKLTFVFDGKEIYSEDVDYNSAITIPSLDGLNKVGHTFAAWNVTVPEKMPANDLTITATFTVNKHDVTVVDQNGDEVASYEDVPYGTEITLPVEEGYTIVWKEGTTNVVPDSDVTLEVVKTVNVYKVVFMDKGEEVTSNDVTYKTSFTIPEDPTAEENFRFIGWDMNNDGIVDEIPETLIYANDVTYVSVYAPLCYDYVIYEEGVEEPIYVGEKEYGTAFELPVREGYTAHWVSEVPETMPAEKVEVTVNFTINSYKLTFVFNGEEISSTEVEYNSEIVIPSLEGLNKVGYSFASWDNDVPETMPASDLTFTAEFTINTHNVTIKDQDGNVIAEHKDVEYGTEIELPSEVGYTIVWKEGTTNVVPDSDVTLEVVKTVNKYDVIIRDQNNELIKVYADVAYGTKIELPSEVGYTIVWAEGTDTTMPDHEVRLSVVKTINTHDVTIKDQDGNVIVKHEDVAYGTEIELPSEVGYTIVWKEGTVTTMPDSDVTLEVVKTVNKYDVTIKDQDGNVIAEHKDVAYNSNVQLPEEEGYTIVWKEGTVAKVPANDVTLEVVKTINKYDVTIKDQDGNVIVKHEDVAYNSNVQLPEEEGYTIVWKEGTVAKVPANDVTLEVVKTVNKYDVTIKDQNGNVIVKHEDVAYNSNVQLPEEEGYTIVWKEGTVAKVPANDVTLEVVKLVDEEFVAEKIDAIINATTIEEKFAAFKACETLLNSYTAAELETLADLVSEYDSLKAAYNNRVESAQTDLVNARKVANWIAYGLVLVASVAAAFIAGRRFF